MLPIAGTIRSAVKLAVLENKWLQKKENGLKKNEELTPQERQLQQLQEQAKQQREQQEYTGIYNKIISGRQLTNEEIEYLRKNNPQALKEYEEIRQERESYKRQLKNCRTKEDVERLKVQKMNGYLSAAKKISTNANIPKSQKKALLEKILAKVWNVQEVHMAFVKSAQYRELPTQQEQEAERHQEAEAAEETAESLGAEQEEADIPENPGAESGTADMEEHSEIKPETSLSFEDVKSTICNLLEKEGAKTRKMNVTV